MPNPAHSIISTSFSPSPNATIRCSVEPEPLGDERHTGRLRDARMPELEQPRQRGGHVEAAVEARRELARARWPGRPAPPPRRAWSVDGRARRAGPRPRSTGMCWNAAYASRVRACASRRRARRRRSSWVGSRQRRAPRSPRAPARAGSARGGGTRRSQARRRARPGSRRPGRGCPPASRYGRTERNIRPVAINTRMPAACAAAIAASVRGVSSASSAISVRSRSQTKASTSRGKPAGRSQPAQEPATVDTYCATSAICWSFSLPLNEGITPLPSVTRSTTSSNDGLASSRFGPTVPVAPASLSV